MFRKMVLILLAIATLGLQGIALADSCPLPEPNTDAEIKFSGFNWYTDYKNTIYFADAKGIKNEWDWSRDNFDEDGCLTPHWYTIYTSINSYAGSEQRCGGYLSFSSSNVPSKVAGYKVDNLKLYLMWNAEKGVPTDYKERDATEFYMARYELDVTDKEAAYNDLVKKLKKLYGDNPYQDTYGSFSPVEYSVWVNQENALVAVSYGEYDVTLVYMAPGAEEKLVKVEEMVKKHEIDSAADDMSGL